MRSVAFPTAALCLVAACGGPPRPTGKATATTTATPQASADPDGMSTPPEATPVATLCRRYVSLKPTKLEGDARDAALAKCASRMEGMPTLDAKYYGCVVKCTYDARTADDARSCRFSCRIPEGAVPASSAEPD